MGVYVLVFVAAFTIFPCYVSTWAVLVLSVVCGLILAGILPRGRAHFVAETLKVHAAYQFDRHFSDGSEPAGCIPLFVENECHH